MEERESLLEAKGIFAIYQGKEGAPNVVALRGVNLDLKKGEFVSVLGTSGSGKSTLLRILGGLQHPSAGRVIYEGTDIIGLSESELVSFRRKAVGFIFQEGNLLPSLSAFNNVVRTLKYSGIGFTERRKTAKEILKRLGLSSRMHALPKYLSGGELQRVAIARAIANQPKLVLADEPTGSLDNENTDHVMALFKELHEDLNTSFFIVTHSQHVASYSERVLELSDGSFIGQHGVGQDIYNLEETRKIIISENGTLRLPPELIGLVNQFGRLWEVEVDATEKNASIVMRPSRSEIKYDQCPVCNKSLEGQVYNCANCGAKLY